MATSLSPPNVAVQQEWQSAVVAVCTRDNPTAPVCADTFAKAKAWQAEQSPLHTGPVLNVEEVWDLIDRYQQARLLRTAQRSNNTTTY